MVSAGSLLRTARQAAGRAASGGRHRATSGRLTYRALVLVLRTIVCEELLRGVEQKYKAAGKVAEPLELIERSIDAACAKVNTPHEKKVCYYLVPIKRKISTPMSAFTPVDRICKKLKKESPELCTVREAIKVEPGKTDYTTLNIRDLKKILADRGQQCSGCLEKSEFVKKCLETEGKSKEEL
jgi:hypothetical protein